MDMLRDTPYAREVMPPAVVKFKNDDGSYGGEARLERLLIKSLGREEIRLSWWIGNRMITRPLDLSERDLTLLIKRAVRQGLLKDRS